MKPSRLKPFAASLMVLVIATQSIGAAIPGPSTRISFSIQLPSALGFVSESYSKAGNSVKPDFILIQNLHTNRSVQHAISGILKCLRESNLLPTRVAIEGAVGNVNIKSMQDYADHKGRKKAADYLISQGEMTGAMHFMVTSGQGQLFGAETADLYDSTIEMYRRSYEGRRRLTTELDKLDLALTKLQEETPGLANAATLAKEVRSLRALADQQLTPEEVAPALQDAVSAMEHLSALWPRDTAGTVLEPLSAAANFYALALLRDTELLKHSLELREMDKQTTTVLVMGGFHTSGITLELKAKGLSYVVITPIVKKHTAVDQRLYVERMLRRHLTPDQVATRRDWASIQAAEPPIAPPLSQMFFGYFSKLSGSTQRTGFAPKRAPQRGSAAPGVLLIIVGAALMIHPMALIIYGVLNDYDIATLPFSYVAEIFFGLTVIGGGAMLLFNEFSVEPRIDRLVRDIIHKRARALLAKGKGIQHIDLPMFAPDYEMAQKEKLIAMFEVLLKKNLRTSNPRFFEHASAAEEAMLELRKLLEPLTLLRVTSHFVASEGSYERSDGEERLGAHVFTAFDFDELKTLHEKVMALKTPVSPEASRKGEKGFSLEIPLAIIVGVLAVGLTAPVVIPALAAVSSVVWIGAAIGAGLLMAAFFGLKVYTDYHVKATIASAANAEVNSIATRLRSRLPNLKFTFARVRDVYGSIRFPFLTPSVEKSLTKKRSDLLFKIAA